VGDDQGIKRFKGYGEEQTLDLARRIGVCREVLLQPILARRYTDAAVNAYAREWCSRG
jgi:hypothetical protein